MTEMVDTKTQTQMHDDDVAGLDEPTSPTIGSADVGDMKTSGQLTLISADEVKFVVNDTERKVVMISKLVTQALDSDPNATEVPIPGAKGSILALVFEYMKHHAGVEPPVIEKPLRSKLMREVCKDKWDATFIDELAVKRQVLYDLILAANYMEVKSLLHLGCAKVASLIKGQPLAKIKDILAVDQEGREGEEVRIVVPLSGGSNVSSSSSPSESSSQCRSESKESKVE